ncbi:MAG TPA: HAMP domain-containing sensor histidine kinase [Thermoanaerobaculia bacterium]|nr:HAMP domain-containing sensor histidine kinase [Thermoanaerobaculia bacterium]
MRSSKKDADAVEAENMSARSAHRDFLRRFLHDLATPLSAVSLHLEAADRRVKRGADPSESLGVARAEIARAFDLFDRGRELLLFEPSSEESVAFDDLVLSAVSGSGAGGAKVEGRTGGFVRADRRALADALSAVLINALEASSAGAVSVAVARSDGGLEVRVENPGRLPAGDPESLFSPRVAAPGKAWGMGLARARLLCAASGGTVRVEQSGDRVATTVRVPEDRP